MTEDIILFETNAATGQVVETRLTGADAEAWRAERSPSTEELWKSLRTKRNQLLAETDYFANTDVTMPDAMRTYRQTLRDLPANTTDPANPIWPTKP